MTRYELAQRNLARVRKSENRVAVLQAKAKLDEAQATLRWRVAVGPVCLGVLELTCRDDAQGRRRCRGASSAALRDRRAAGGWKAIVP